MSAEEGVIRRKNRVFASWRKQRPFFAGLCMVLSGAVILTPAYLEVTISNILIQISTISGVSTLIIGCLLITCGLMTWFRGDSRILAGVAALILGIVALPTSNFGGFIIGTMLALFGGSLALSWMDEIPESAETEPRETEPADAGEEEKSVTLSQERAEEESYKKYTEGYQGYQETDGEDEESILSNMATTDADTAEIPQPNKTHYEE